jgi:hypothetical protein
MVSWLLQMNEIRLETEAVIQRTEALNLDKQAVAAKLAGRLRELKLGGSQTSLQGCCSHL